MTFLLPFQSLFFSVVTGRLNRVNLSFSIFITELKSVIVWKGKRYCTARKKSLCPFPPGTSALFFHSSFTLWPAGNVPAAGNSSTLSQNCLSKGNAHRLQNCGRFFICVRLSRHGFHPTDFHPCMLFCGIFFRNCI